MSEHYSKATNDINSNLYRACKTAKEKSGSLIAKFYVNYKYASVHFKGGQKKNYDLKKIQERADWYNF